METLYRKYKRTQTAEMRSVTAEEIEEGLEFNISVSNEDFENGSPKIGDMIARNPKNHNDQWLVAEEYYKDNFAPMDNDHTAQLQADKEELLEALEEIERRYYVIATEPNGIVRETMIDSLTYGISDLIQKHKQ